MKKPYEVTITITVMVGMYDEYDIDDQVNDVVNDMLYVGLKDYTVDLSSIKTSVEER